MLSGFFSLSRSGDMGGGMVAYDRWHCRQTENINLPLSRSSESSPLLHSPQSCHSDIHVEKFLKLQFDFVTIFHIAKSETSAPFFLTLPQPSNLDYQTLNKMIYIRNCKPPPIRTSHNRLPSNKMYILNIYVYIVGAIFFHMLLFSIRDKRRASTTACLLKNLVKCIEKRQDLVWLLIVTQTNLK